MRIQTLKVKLAAHFLSATRLTNIGWLGLQHVL
jgi:hypothetical protein